MSTITHTPKAKTRVLLQSQQMYNSRSLGGTMKINTRTSVRKSYPRAMSGINVRPLGTNGDSSSQVQENITENESFDAGSEGTEGLESTTSEIVASDESSQEEGISEGTLFSSLSELWDSVSEAFSVDNLKEKAISDLIDRSEEVLNNTRVFFKDVFLVSSDVKLNLDIDFANFSEQDLGDATVIVSTGIDTDRFCAPESRRGIIQSPTYCICNVADTIQVVRLEGGNVNLDLIFSNEISYKGLGLGINYSNINKALAESLVIAVGANALGLEAQLYQSASLATYDGSSDIAQQCFFYGAGVLSALVESQEGSSAFKGLLNNLLQDDFLTDILSADDATATIMSFVEGESVVVATDSILNGENLAVDLQFFLSGESVSEDLGLSSEITVNVVNTATGAITEGDVLGVILDSARSDAISCVSNILKADAYDAIARAGILLDNVRSFLSSVMSLVADTAVAEEKSAEIQEQTGIIAESATSNFETLALASDILADVNAMLAGHLSPAQIPLADAGQDGPHSPLFVVAVEEVVKDSLGKEDLSDVSTQQAMQVLDSKEGQVSVVDASLKAVEALVKGSSKVAKQSEESKNIVFQALDFIMSKIPAESNTNDVSEDFDQLKEATARTAESATSAKEQVVAIRNQLKKRLNSFKGEDKGMSTGAKVTLGLGATALLGLWWYNRKK